MASLETTNTFTEGLNQDLHPIATKNTLLTDSKNATFITFNGNEMSLQNDLGNTRLTYTNVDDEGHPIVDDVVPVTLTEGFVPIGMKEHGGIVYIASVKPNGVDENGNTKYISELGTFPSPEYVTDPDKEALEHSTVIVKDTEKHLEEKKSLCEDDVILHAGDRLDDYIFDNINYEVISNYKPEAEYTASEDVRRLYKYIITNQLSGKDITNDCKALDLSSGLISSLKDTSIISNYAYDYNVVYPSGSSLKIYYNYTDNKKSFIFPNILKSKIALEFKYEDIDDFTLVSYYKDNPTEVEVFGPTASYDSSGYIQLNFDKLRINNPAWVKVNRIQFKYRIYDENGNPLSLPITSNWNIGEDTRQGCTPVITKGTVSPTSQFLPFSKKEAEIDISDLTIKLNGIPGVDIHSNKYKVYFKILPINTIYGVDLSSHTIERTVDLSKSNQSFDGDLIQETESVDISVHNIWYDYGENSATFYGYYLNAINSGNPDDFITRVKLFEKLFNTTTSSKQDKQGNYIDINFRYYGKTGNNNSTNSIISHPVLVLGKPEDTGYSHYLPKEQQSLGKDNGSYYAELFDEACADKDSIKCVQFAEPLNFTVGWIVNFINPSFTPFKFDSINYSKEPKFAILNQFFCKNIKYNVKAYKLKPYTAGVLRMCVLDVDTHKDSFPKTYFTREVLYENNNSLYPEQYAIQELYGGKTGTGDQDLIIENYLSETDRDTITSSNLYVQTIPSGSFKRELGIFTTEKYEKPLGVGNFGIYSVTGAGVVDGTDVNLTNPYNLYDIRHAVEVTFIEMNKTDYTETIEDCIIKDYKQTSNSTKYPVDKEGNKLLWSNNIDKSCIIKPIDITDVRYCDCAKLTDDGSVLYRSQISIPEIPLYETAKLYNTLTDFYSRYKTTTSGYNQPSITPLTTDLINNDNKSFTMTFDKDQFDGYKYGVIMMYLSNSKDIEKVSSNYKLSKPFHVISDSNVDKVGTLSYELTNTESEKLNRMSMVVDLSTLDTLSTTKDLKLTFSLKDNIYIYNPILYLIDDLDEDEEGNLLCAQFRAQHMTIDTTKTSALENSKYNNLLFPVKASLHPQASLAESFDISEKPLKGYYPLPFYDIEFKNI